MPSTPLNPGSYYHIYNRGNNKEDLFLEKNNYDHFLRLYALYIPPVAATYAYCLLRNHFHLLVRIRTVAEQLAWRKENNLEASEQASTKARNPSRQFSNLFNAYTKAINKRYGRTGSLFERPFSRIEVTSPTYFAQLVTYIHQNPQRHGFVDDFRDWRYSSYETHLSHNATRLEREETLRWFNGRSNHESMHHLILRPEDLPLEKSGFLFET